jgi:hypothetical protein
VESTVEDDHGLPLREQPGKLDGVLDCFRTCIEERAACLAADRSERSEPFSEIDVTLVRDDGEVRVEEPLRLLDDRRDHARMVVPHVGDADATDEVDEGVAVDVRDRGAAGAVGDDRLVHDERTGDCALLALEDLAAARAGNLRPYLDHARRRHLSQRIRPTRR